MTFLHQVTANGQRPAWALKLDVANFFPSIHQATLRDILLRHVRHPELQWLTRALLLHDPTTNYRFQARTPGMPGPDSPYSPVPTHTSLFEKQNERGLLLGHLTGSFCIGPEVRRAASTSPRLKLQREIIGPMSNRAAGPVSQDEAWPPAEDAGIDIAETITDGSCGC